MSSLLSIPTVKRPTTVRALAKSVFMTDPISVRKLMGLVGVAAQPRPFYLIAHACNDVEEVKENVAAGANAIECDIERANTNKTGVDISEWEFAVRHSPSPLGVPIKPYLDGVAKIVKANKHVALVYFDIKDPNVDLMRLREIIHQHLTSVVPDLHIALSHSNYDGRTMFNPITKDTPKEGLLIDEDDYPTRVADYFLQKKLKRFGYGNGVATPGVPLNIPSSIMRAVYLKWKNREIRWVYTFTLASQVSMRDYIAKGVDGIMVNDVPALKAVLNEPGVKKQVRLATRDDDPFAPAVHPSYGLTVQTASSFGAGTDANLTFALTGSAGTISTTIDAYPAGLFEAGDINHVTLIGKDVGTITKLMLSHDGDGDWEVATVKVTKARPGEPPSVVTFNFNQVISPDTPVTRTPS